MRPIIQILSTGLIFIIPALLIAQNQPTSYEEELGNKKTILDDCENFDDLAVGTYVAEQLGDMWTTWGGTPGTAEDALVSDMYSYNGNNSFVVDAGTIDLVLELADEPIATGQHLYSHMIYIPSGTSGYFNVQSHLTPGIAWVVSVYFNDDGTCKISENGFFNEFTYAQDTWILVEINFDLTTANAEVLFDGVLFYEWNNPIATIAGINYFGWTGGGEPGAYYDEVCFGQGWVIPDNPLGIPQNLAGPYVVYANIDFNLTWEEPIPGGNFKKEDYGSNEFLGYNVYRRFNIGPFQLQGFTTELFYTENVPLPIFWSYYVTAVYDEGESDPSNLWIIEPVVGIDESMDNAIELYPNPATGQLHISNIYNAQIYIYNILGQLVLETDKVSDKVTLNMSDIENGNYILKVVGDNLYYTQQIIVTK